MTAMIRLATVQDLPAIDAIYNHYVLHSTCTYQTHPNTAAERLLWFEERADLPQYAVTVATDGDQIIGWASLNPYHKRAAYRHTAENSVYVHADRQRQGIGRALLTDLLRRADAVPFHSVIAVISADQAPSIALHRALGFSACGLFREVGHKFGGWLDVLTMQRFAP